MNRHGMTLWFTGLPSSGKTTLAGLVGNALKELGLPVEILDGDEVRQRLTKGLGFSKEDRFENISRIAYVAKLLTRVGAVAIVAAISPYREMRSRAKAEIKNFVEIYVNCPLPVCIERDVKGLYAKALAGEITNLTGISDPYESPLAPEIVVQTDKESAEQSVALILDKLASLDHLNAEMVRSLQPGRIQIATEIDALLSVSAGALGNVSR